MRLRVRELQSYGFEESALHPLISRFGKDALVEATIWIDECGVYDVAVKYNGESVGYISTVHPDASMLFDDSETEIVPVHKIAPPPRNAEFLFYLFMDAKSCNALVGDLEERYKLIHKKFGARRANFWYWTQTITSLAPIVWAATKRVTKALTGVGALLELYRRIRS